MSLIGDALRKTRQEEAERDNERKGVLFSAKIANPPARSNLGLGLALGAIIAVAATVAGGGAVWWLLSRGDAAQPEATDTVPSGVPGSIETDETSSRSNLPGHTGSDSPAQSPPAAAAPSAAATGAGPTDLGPSQPAARPAAAVAAPATVTSGEKAFEGGFAGVEDGADVFILEAKFGKVELSLDFIIFRPDDPFAEINGIELHIGGVIEGYRVKTIERDRVHLSNGRKDIVLRTP
jgi:hypothetical protein